ncbi:hypothetical protein CDL15_Pgr004848 [Punica granatum]|uniref:Uncharacterized protein n=1 Tax=Punica granatum TaxID=22663 RepID=A0A218W6V8_PUNGR|nr:hypothetical protein CDL15_Pgr004848 [Punica granatum]
MDRVGSDRLLEGETARKSCRTRLERWAKWAELLGWTYETRKWAESQGNGPSPISEERSGSGGAAVSRLRAAVLAPERLNDGTRGRERWLWTLPTLRRGRSGPHRS